MPLLGIKMSMSPGCHECVLTLSWFCRAKFMLHAGGTSVSTASEFKPMMKMFSPSNS
eukprot:CAMPEP_0185272032 /NCGR_PEP_ID=MMETSP1359-20130426/46177_1 /TAXON_ID=552665 /ORGANISM="Bigelowiella longifila, Strain CCMP242" /LENGTH=56 /DNA_ID=CAMNT_0027864167 /DNA_START=206 /DNA_END=373 /DNA_ORIENTATION=-